MILHKLIELHQNLDNSYKIKLEDYQLAYGQWKILKEIYLKENDTLTANDLVKLEKSDKRLISKTLVRLEELDYVVRVDGGDRRKKELYLTELGLDIAADLVEIETEIEAEIEVVITSKEEFIETLDNINRKLKK